MRPQLDLEKMQKENPHPELTAHIAALGKMRKENPVLADGKYRELVLTNRQYAYARIKDQDAIVVAANNDESPADMSIPPRSVSPRPARIGMASIMGTTAMS